MRVYAHVHCMCVCGPGVASDRRVLCQISGDRRGDDVVGACSVGVGVGVGGSGEVKSAATAEVMMLLGPVV